MLHTKNYLRQKLNTIVSPFVLSIAALTATEAKTNIAVPDFSEETVPVDIDETYIVKPFYDENGKLVKEEKTALDANNNKKWLFTTYYDKNGHSPKSEKTEFNSKGTIYSITVGFFNETAEGIRLESTKFSSDGKKEFFLEKDYKNGVLQKLQHTKFNSEGNVEAVIKKYCDEHGKDQKRELIEFDSAGNRTYILAVSPVENGGLKEERTEFYPDGNVRSISRISYDCDLIFRNKIEEEIIKCNSAGKQESVSITCYGKQEKEILKAEIFATNPNECRIKEETGEVTIILQQGFLTKLTLDGKFLPVRHEDIDRFYKLQRLLTEEISIPNENPSVKKVSSHRIPSSNNAKVV